MHITDEDIQISAVKLNIKDKNKEYGFKEAQLNEHNLKEIALNDSEVEQHLMQMSN